MEIRVQGHDRSALIAGQLDDLWIACLTAADVRDVADIDPSFFEATNGAAREFLVQE